MPHRLPRQFPSFGTLVDDVLCSRRALAIVLDVHPRTLQRWIDADDAPRTAILAVFWLTRWGVSTIAADAHNAATAQAGLAAALRVELMKAQRQIARMQRAIDAVPTGAANAPVYSGESVPLIEAGSA